MKESDYILDTEHYIDTYYRKNNIGLIMADYSGGQRVSNHCQFSRERFPFGFSKTLRLA